MPFGFDSVYGNGGQNAIYTARFGGGGGAGGAGGGGNLNAQMQAMSSFDPAAYLNVAQENAYNRDRDLFSRAQAVRESDRRYAERQASKARNRASREQVWDERQARGAQSQAMDYARSPQAQGSPFQTQQRYQQMLDMFRRGQTGPQRAVSMMGGPQSMAYGNMAQQMAALQAAGLPIADYTGMTELAKALSGSSTASVEAANKNLRQLRTPEPNRIFKEGG